jgi:hypothetical protein
MVLALRNPLAVTALALLGCSSVTDPSKTVASLRMVNALTDGPAVTFVIDGEHVAERLDFGAATEYATAPADGVIEVRHAVTNTTMLTLPLSLTAGGVYTLLLTGSSSGVVLMVEPDTESRPAAGNAKLRVIHVAPDAAPIDLYLTEPGSTDPLPWLQPFEYLTATPYRQGQPGMYVISALLAGTDEVTRTHTLQLLDGRARTVVIIDGGNIYVAFLDLSDFL